MSLRDDLRYPSRYLYDGMRACVCMYMYGRRRFFGVVRCRGVLTLYYTATGRPLIPSPLPLNTNFHASYPALLLLPLVFPSRMVTFLFTCGVTRCSPPRSLPLPPSGATLSVYGALSSIDPPRLYCLAHIPPYLLSCLPVVGGRRPHMLCTRRYNMYIPRI